MLKSKPWNWEIADAARWSDPADEVYSLVSRWKRLGFKKILDLGCGVGRHSVLFAENGFSVSATDFGKEGLEKLAIIAKEKKLRIEIKHADMILLPFKDSSFDCLLAYHVIYHQDDLGIVQVIKEIRRVLKKGGEAYVTFNSKNCSAFKAEDVKRISKNTIVKTSGHEAGIAHYYASKKDVEKLLEGFENLEFSYRENYYPDYTSAHYFTLVKNKFSGKFSPKKDVI